MEEVKKVNYTINLNSFFRSIIIKNKITQKRTFQNRKTKYFLEKLINALYIINAWWWLLNKENHKQFDIQYSHRELSINGL